MRWMSRFRERLVLGPVRSSLDDDERILAWAHVRVPGVRAPGVALVTQHRCLLHVVSRDVDDHTSSWAALDGWHLEHPARARARLTLVSDGGQSVSELSLTTPARARAGSQLLAAISDCTDVPCEGSPPPSRRQPRERRVTWQRRSEQRPPPQLEAAPRRILDHVRRVGVTVVGALVLLLSLVFASPFVPGPGALTAVAGIAILATEYEWARDLHVWASRQLDRFLAWLRARKAARAARRRVREEPERVDATREAA